MIELREINNHAYTTTPEIDANLSILLARLNAVREAYNIPMVITSGLRSPADQARINPKAPKSRHLTGEAADIADADGKLKDWVKANLDLIEKIGLWMEDFNTTTTWVHFQTVPPKSGNRFFTP